MPNTTPLLPAGLALLLVSLCHPGHAQEATPAAEPAALTAAVRNLTERYLSSRGNEAGLNDGAEYVGYDGPAIDGHPFFGSDEPQPGRVRYNGFTYEEVPLQYDIRFDVLVVQSTGGPAKLRLISEKVEAFGLNGHRFVRRPAGNGLPAAAFYEVLADRPGQVQVLARHTKQLRSVAGQAVQQVFLPVDAHYLYHRGRYHPVSSKADVLAVLADKKKELSRYARAQQLSFSKAGRAAAITALVEQYATLTPGA